MKKILIIMQFLLLQPHLSLAATRISPVDHGTVTSGIGWRLDPFGSGRTVTDAAPDEAGDAVLVARTHLPWTLRSCVYVR